MTNHDFIWRFTPSRTDPELLSQIFVQRQELLKDILERITESADTKNKHHVLLIGPRGIGKTHLVSLLHHRITQKSKLAQRLRVAWFLEDETVTSFVQLLKRIYELLAEAYSDEFPSSWLDGILQQSPEQIEKRLKAELIRLFEKRTLLLFIENLDYLFSGLGSEGQHKWRSFLQEHPFTCIVATSQRLFNGVQKREQPFFGFFAPIHLKPLEVDDAVELLSNIAEQRSQPNLKQFLDTPEGRSRVRALHHLTGGNHRIYIVLSGFITRESLDELSQPFEKMADELTPYYQERMRWLSPQQRQIVEFLCAQDSPCTPKQMSRQLLAAENTISSQLKKLSEFGYVMKSPRGRESLYELTEPLMRLASEVKDKRRKPMRLLVDFLRIWYRVDHLSKLLQTTNSESLKDYLWAALSQAISDSILDVHAIRKIFDSAQNEGRLEDLMTDLEKQAHTTNTNSAWFNLGYCQNKLKRYDETIACYDKLLDVDPQDAFIWKLKVISLLHLKRYDKAIVCSGKALEIDSQDANAWTLKGIALAHQKRYDEAIACYDKALKIEPQDTSVWNLKGSLLDELECYDEAIACYEKALEIEPQDAYAAFNRAEALFALCRWEEGFATLRKTFVQHPGSSGSDVGLIIHLIESRSEGAEEQRNHVETLIGIYSDGEALIHLGNGLVRSLRKLDVARLSEAALEEWRDRWLDSAAGHMEMELPLRVFRVGMVYFIRGNDERVLIDLIATERRILQQALGLEPVSD